MNEICRFCLSFSTQNMVPLSEFDESLNILKGLTIHIPTNASLPCQVCSTCKIRLNQLNEFHSQVQKNEEILLNYLNLGSAYLNAFYEEIKTGIKKETNGPIVENVLESVENSNEAVLQEVKIEDELDVNAAESNSVDEDLSLSEIKTIINDCEPQAEAFTDNSQFKCLTCFKKFKTPSNLINHYRNDHKSEVKNKITFTKVIEDGKKIYRCDECSKSYDSRKKVNKHFSIHSDERFHCKMCGRTYKCVSDIMRHSRAHDGPKVACSVPGCQFATVYSGALKYHENMMHKKDFKYKCDTCGKGFQVKTWYEQHQNIHKGLKPYVCDICGMKFHMDRYLTTHRTSIHPNTSPLGRYVCTQCSTPCGTIKALRAHLREHGITSSFLCDLCGKTLSTGDQLKTHRRTHLGIKPFSCTVCDKRFSKKANLKLHQVAHTGERTHVCECGKLYSQRSSLLRHITKHHNGSAKSSLKGDKSIKYNTKCTGNS